MKLASTVLAAYAVTPKTTDSTRSQSTWYMRPLMPDRKKSTARAASDGLP